MTNKVFKPGIELIGKRHRPDGRADSDLFKAVLFVFPHEGGLTIRHKPYLTPQMLIELGEKISELGRRLQQ